MVSARDANPDKLIMALASELESKLKMPEWAEYVKTGTSRERSPDQKNWWFIRSASILRKVYFEGPIGTAKLRTYYGSLKNRGHKPSKFKKASGKILRVILQDLEKSGFVKQNEKGKKGRVIAPAGQKFVDGVAKKVK